MKWWPAWLVFTTGLTGLAAPPPAAQLSAQPLSGTLLARTETQAGWSLVARSTHAPWLYTQSDGQAVVAFANQSQLRMSEGTLVHVQSSQPESLQMELMSGQVFVTTPSGRAVTIQTPGGRVTSGGGDFIVRMDGTEARVDVLQGRARLYGSHLSLPDFGPLADLTEVKLQPGLGGVIAMEGPDVRVRHQKPKRRFVQGEENQGRRLGETETPTPSPSPPPPVVTQPPPPQPPPPPPEEGPPVEVDAGGGGDFWPYLGGALGAAGLAILFNNLDDDEEALLLGAGTPASP